jgi:hypothetical protein
MPIELKPKTSTNEAAPEETQGLMLFNEDGELTLAGETVTEFLASADFSAVMESPDAAPFLTNPAHSATDPYATDEDGDEDEEGGEAEGGEEAPADADAPAEAPAEEPAADGDEAPAEEPAADADTDDGDHDSSDADADASEELALPGVVAARLVDESDLVEMFGYFLDQLAEREEPSLQEQATLAVFENLRGAEGGIDEDSREEVAALLLSVLSEGFVYGELDEKNMTKSQRRKATKIRNRPQSGKRRATNKKRRREEGRGAKKVKIARQHKMRNRKKMSRIAQLARESEEGTLVFGLGEGINGANFRIGLAEDPNLEFTDEQLIEFDELGGHLVECPDADCAISSPFAAFIVEAKKKKAKKKKMDADGDYDDSPEDEKSEDRDGVCPECECVVENMLDEKGKVPDAFKKNMKGKKKDDDGDDDKDGDDKDDKPAFLKKKGKKDESIAPSHVPGAFAVAAGRPNLSEGHSLAAATLGVMGRAKAPALTEDED